jgi:ribonuclease Z
MGFYDWETWPNFFQVNFHSIAEEEMALVLENEEFRIYASPVRHIIPTIGLRIESVRSGKVIAYSCDTEPCPQVERLGSKADVLIHEASGASYGHTSPEQAGELASRCQARSLYLIHYPTRGIEEDQLVQEAQRKFSGPVNLAKDFLELEL